MAAYKLIPEWKESLKFPEKYLQKIREESQETLFLSGYPDPKNESWRFSNLKRLETFINLPLSSKLTLDYQKEYPLINNKPKNLLQIKINSTGNNLNPAKLPNGIRVLNDSELGNHLGRVLGNCKSRKEWSTIINESTASNVLGLEISGQDIPPIEFLLPAELNGLNSTRIFLKIGKNTNIKVAQVIFGSKNSAQSHLMEMMIEENSKVEHGFIALGGGNGNLIANLSIEQKKKSNYSLISMHEGWFFSRFEPNIIQLEGKAKTALKGLQIADEDHNLSTHSKVRFDGPEGELDQLNKASANKNSHSIFNGAIQVPKIAQKTQASQLSRNLILSKRSQIDTKPELEIIADDVRCTHGATVSQLQEEELFYLRSRGIGSKQAYSLLLEGYYQEILNELPLYSLRWNFLNSLLSKSSA